MGRRERGTRRVRGQNAAAATVEIRKVDEVGEQRAEGRGQARQFGHEARRREGGGWSWRLATYEEHQHGSEPARRRRQSQASQKEEAVEVGERARGATLASGHTHMSQKESSSCGSTAMVACWALCCLLLATRPTPGRATSARTGGEGRGAGGDCKERGPLWIVGVFCLCVAACCPHCGALGCFLCCCSVS